MLALMAKVEAAPELVRLGQDGRGRFTTREMLDTEQRMERAAGALADRDGHRVLQAAGWRAARGAERNGVTLEEEQRAAFRALAEQHGAVEITTVRRQHEEWQRDATRELATGRTEQAFERYAAAGMVLASETRAEARGACGGLG